jgi:MFS family permease
MTGIKSTIFASMTLSVLANAVILPILAPLIRTLHLSASQGGWMISIGSVAMALTAAAWGAASDRFGRKSVMLAGFAGLFVSQALYTATIWCGLSAALAGPALFVLLAATRGIVGGFLPAVPAGAQALMADHTAAHERSSGMAIIGAASGLGLVLGPALGGLLALRGLLWPLVLATLLCLLAALVVFVAVPRTAPQVRDRPAPLNPFAPALLPWLLAGVITMSAVVTVQISVGFYFQDRLGLTTAETGPKLAIALTLVGVALFATQLLQVRVLRWPARRMVLAGAVAWLAGLLVLLFTARIATYFLAYSLLGMGAGLLMPGYMAGASLAVPPDRQGAVAGFAAATQGIGFILAPVASTMLYEIDRELPLWCLVAVMVLLFLLFTLRHPAAAGDRPAAGETVAPGTRERS